MAVITVISSRVMKGDMRDLVRVSSIAGRYETQYLEQTRERNIQRNYTPVIVRLEFKYPAIREREVGLLAISS